MPTIGLYNITSGNFVPDDGILSWAIMIVMFLIGIVCIVLAFVQDGSKYVTGTLMKKNLRPDYEVGGSLPKNYDPYGSSSKEHTQSETSTEEISHYEPFIDIENKVWKIKDKEFPVIENISESDLQWFSDKIELTEKVGAGKIEMTQEEADKIDEEVREKLYKVGMNTGYKTIQSYLTREEEGKLFGELFVFVRQIKTIENAIQHPMFNPSLQQSGKLNKFDLENNFLRFTWQEAEDLVGKLFEKKGYSVTVTQRSADFGIDVEAKNTETYLGIQVKHWNGQVGFEDVAKTLGVAQKFNKVIIINTKSGFTSQAWTHANANPYLIELWDSNRFKQELTQYVIGK